MAPSAARYAALLHGAHLCEPTSPASLPGELEIQSRWFAACYGTRFLTTCGKTVEIIHFGTWNHAAGPDFLAATIKIDGTEKTGPIEIDLEAKSWESHGHAENPSYNETVLHLFLATGTKSQYFTRTEDHREVPQIILTQENDVTPFPLPRPLPESKPGRCSAPLADLPASEIESLFQQAATYRLQRKARALHRTAAATSRDQALFQGVAEALGYRRCRLPMRVLAQRHPLDSLRANPSTTEARLFGSAGFLIEPTYESVEDEDTRNYLRALWDTWWKHRAEYQPHPAKAITWKLAGTRPTNHPQRRLAALALLVTKWEEFAALAETAPPATITKFLTKLEHPYWSHHYTLKSAATEKPTALIGAARANDIFINWILPHRLQEEEITDALWETYAALPSRHENEKSRRAAVRLLGHHQDTKELTKKAYHHQALLQIYDDFCLQDTTDCQNCPFPEQLHTWQK